MKGRDRNNGSSDQTGEASSAGVERLVRWLEVCLLGVALLPNPKLTNYLLSLLLGLLFQSASSKSLDHMCSSSTDLSTLEEFLQNNILC